VLLLVGALLLAERHLGHQARDDEVHPAVREQADPPEQPHRGALDDVLGDGHAVLRCGR